MANLQSPWPETKRVRGTPNGEIPQNEIIRTFKYYFGKNVEKVEHRNAIRVFQFCSKVLYFMERHSSFRKSVQEKMLQFFDSPDVSAENLQIVAELYARIFPQVEETEENDEEDDNDY